MVRRFPLPKSRVVAWAPFRPVRATFRPPRPRAPLAARRHNKFGRVQGTFSKGSLVAPKATPGRAAGGLHIYSLSCGDGPAGFGLGGVDEAMEHFFHAVDGHGGIQARAVGAFVEHAVDGQGVGVLDAAGQVAVAGHGDDHARPQLDHDAAGDGAARGHGQVDAVLVVQLEQPGDGAFAAPFAVVDVVGQPFVAARVLQAVRHEQQDVPGRVPARLGQDQVVVDRDEGQADVFLVQAEDAADEHHERQEKLDGQPPVPFGSGHGPLDEDIEEQPPVGHADDADEAEHDDAESPGRGGVDVSQPDVGNDPQPGQEQADHETGDADESHEKAFARLVYGRGLVQRVSLP